MQLIGLCGLAGAGKDFTHQTIETFFENDPKTTVFRVSFADGLRYEIQELFDPDPDAYIPALWTKPYPEGIRWILQHYGTEFRRVQDPDYWVKKAQGYIEELDQVGYVVVVTDVRFDNEATMIKDLGGMVVQVDAPRGIRAGRIGTLPDESHASEEIDFPVDAVIRNTGVPVLPAEVLDFLGLDYRCNGCITLDPKLCR